MKHKPYLLRVLTIISTGLLMVLLAGVAAGQEDAAQSTVAVSSTSVTTDDGVVVTVQARDENGDAISDGGATVVINSTGSGLIFGVTDLRDGTYTASLSNSTAETVTITATLNGAAVAGAADPTVTFSPGAADASLSTLAVSNTSATTDGTVTVTVQAIDQHGNTITTGGDTVTITSTSSGSVSIVADNADGTYTATLADTVAETVTVSAKLNTVEVTGSENPSVTFTPGTANASQSTVTVSNTSVTTDGTVTVTVQAVDQHGNTITTGGDTFAGTSSSSGTVSNFADNTNGTYTATLANTVAETVTVSVTLNTVAVTGSENPSVTFTPGAADPSQSTVTVGNTSVNVDETVIITVQAIDAGGNNLTSGGATVIISSTGSGSLSNFSNTGNGTYTTNLTNNTAEQVTVSATLGGVAITGATNPTVTFLGPEIEVSQGGVAIANDDSVDFGFVDATDTSSVSDLTFTITNSGGPDLSLGDFTITEVDGGDNNAFSLESTSSYPSVVAAGTPETFIIRFTTDYQGAHEATFSFTNNDDDENPFNITLVGDATSPVLRVQDPDGTRLSATVPAQFGYNAPGDSETLEITIMNLGDGDIEDLDVTLPEETSDYTLTAPTGSPTTLAGGGETTFTITFTPVDEERDVETLVRVSGSNISDYEFTANGDSAPTPAGEPDAFGYKFLTDLPLSGDELSAGDTGVISISSLSSQAQSINIGFPFSFYENTYTSCGVSKNGLITFDGSNGIFNVPAEIPSEGSSPNNFIAPFWSSLDSGTLLYTTRGVAPGRVFVLQFTDFTQTSGTGQMTFQVLLYEGSNNIEFHYRSVDIALTSTSNPLSIGVQNSRGTIGLGYWFGRQDGVPSPGYTAQTFPIFPSVIRFIRPVRARVISAYRGQPNDGTRVACESTSGLEIDMYVSGDPLAEGTRITEIIDNQTFVITPAATASAENLVLTATNFDPDAADTDDDTSTDVPIQPSFVPINELDAGSYGPDYTSAGYDYQEKQYVTRQVYNNQAEHNYNVHVGGSPAAQSTNYSQITSLPIAYGNGGNAIYPATNRAVIFGAAENYTIRVNGYLDMRTYAAGTYTIHLGADDTNKFIMDTADGQVNAVHNCCPQNHATSFTITTGGLFPFDNVFCEQNGGDWFEIGISGPGIDGIKAFNEDGSPPVYPIGSYTDSGDASQTTVTLSSCSTNDDDSDEMLASATSDLDLGYSPVPGETYSLPYDQETRFEAPEFIYLNSNFLILSGPGDPSKFDADDPAKDIAVYRLANQGYAVDGQAVQGTDTFFSVALTEDVTVVWRWRLEYAVFIEAASSTAGQVIELQNGVGNPSPALGRHWVRNNSEFTAVIDRVSGNDFLNSDTGGFRYATEGYEINGSSGTGQARETLTEDDLGDTGNKVSTTATTVKDWTVVQWLMSAQVRYRFDASSASNTTERASFLGQAFVRVSDLLTGAITDPTYNSNALNEVWIDVGDKVEVGAFYRTEDRCFTLTDFPGSQGGDLSTLSTSISDLEDLEFPDSSDITRVARVHYVENARLPTTVSFFYVPTIFRAEIALGESFDALNPDTHLVPQLCADAELRASSLGPNEGYIPVGTSPGGTITGAPVRWDQLGKRLYPVHPGSYRIQWPDTNDPNTVYYIEIVTGYPGATASLVSERETLLASGDSIRETSTTNSGLPVPDSQDNHADELYYVTSVTLPRVTEDFPGSLSAPGLDAHYRHLFDTSSDRMPPSRLDLLTTDQWNFLEMTYSDTSTNPLVDPATEGTAFTPQGEGRCVLLYSLRPNPDEAANGSMPDENLVVRVVRSETKTSLDADDSKLVLGRRSLELDDASDLRLDGTAADIALGDSFVVDFWLNAQDLRSDDGDVTVFGTGDDLLKITLSNNLSETSVVLQSETQQILVPFGFSSADELVVTNVSTGDTLEEGTDYQVANGQPSGAPNGSVTLLDTPVASAGDQIRVQLETPLDPAGRITATCRGVEVSHSFSTEGIDWRHYVIHVFPSSFFGTGITVVDFYKDGVREEQAVVTGTSDEAITIDPDASALTDALRFGVGADPESKLKLDQFRVFGSLPVTRLDDGTSSASDPWLTPDEVHDLRTEQDTALRTTDPQLAFSFEDTPSSGSFANSNTSIAAEIGSIPDDSDGEYLGFWGHNDIQEVATRLNSTLDNAGFAGRGYILNEISNYNADIYDRDAQVGSWGPVFPVNDGSLYTAASKRLEIAYYENPFRTDPVTHPNVAWPYEAAAYDEVQYPAYGPNKDNAIYIASRLGSEGVDQQGKAQEVFDLDRYANFKIYNQDDSAEAGFNPNEEHALAAGANRAALKIKEAGEDIPNNPPLAAFALQNEINETTEGSSYTSDPWVLAQFDNLVTGESEMAAYQVIKTRTGTIPFPRPSDTEVSATTGLEYESAENPEDRFLTMDPEETYDFAYQFSYEAAAGDLLIPPYPLNLVIGNAVMADTRGGNVGASRSLWRDVNRTAWVVSGEGEFFCQYFYPFRSDFYLSGAASGEPVAWVPDTGTTSFLGDNEAADSDDDPKPVKVTYETFWGSDYSKLKRGETLTYQGGEYFNETPGSEGLPALVAMAAAEIVYDDATPSMAIDDSNRDSYSARIIRPLDRREHSFTVDTMENSGFEPSLDSLLIVAERWYFKDLPGSLQKRFYFDSLAEKLVFRGYLNDKESGDGDLTEGPDPINILEPNVMTLDEWKLVRELSGYSTWESVIDDLYETALAPDSVRYYDSSNNLTTPASRIYPTTTSADIEYLAGVQELAAVTLEEDEADLSDAETESLTLIDELQSELLTRWQKDTGENNYSLDSDASSGDFAHLSSFGVGSALVASPNVLTDTTTGSTYITIAENNRPELDGAPISLHIIEIIPDRYRGALKVIEGADAFSEKITIQHNGEFGANTDDLYYEWWIRDAASLDVVAEEILDDGSLTEVDLTTGQTLWQEFLPLERSEDGDLTEAEKHQGLHSIVFEGRPDIILADKLVLMRYRHKDEEDWNLVPFDVTDAATEWAPGTSTTAAPFQWAGAANSPQLQADGSKRYIPQLVMGWVKRVLDRINPYEARYTDFFSNESPAVYSSQIQIAGAPFAGAVALNPDKNVIENIGLIELYETVLARAKALSIDNSSNPVSTDGINQAILLAATRLAVLYELLAREAYSDAQDSTITVSEDSGLTNVASFTHAFQNIEASLQHEELALLRGTDFLKSYPVYNRMFWNYAKGLGEAAYNVNYNVQDENMDGFINEDDARALYPQGHGDAWGHFLSALGMHYDLLQQSVFQWNSRAELYSLMENVLEVDYLDEKTFAKLAAGKARAGRDIVRSTYRLHYTQDPDGQWQGYTDGADPARGWGVSEWAHRSGQAAYFDWAVANALLPEEAENATPVENPENLDLIERSVATAEIGLIASGLLEIQIAMDAANSGMNPLAFDSDALNFDLNVEFYENASGGDPRSHFEQILARAVVASNNASATLGFATQAGQKLRSLANDTDALMVAALEQDLDYRNRLIEIFGRPYDGQIGFGEAYPEGYLGPDVLLYSYLDRNTVAQIIPTDTRAADRTITANIQFDDIKAKIAHIANDPTVMARYKVRDNSSMLSDSISTFVTGASYQDPLSLTLPLPVQRTAAYSFLAGDDWGQRLSYGLLQNTLEEMLAEEIALQATVDEYFGFLGDLDSVVLALLNTIERMKDTGALRDKIDVIRKTINSLILIKKSVYIIIDALANDLIPIADGFAEMLPTSLGFSNDFTAPARGAIRLLGASLKDIPDFVRAGLDIAELVAELLRDELIADTERDIARVESVGEIEGLLVEFENLSGNDAPMRANIGGHLQRLEILRQEYITRLNTGFSLLREREAFNKILAASVQKNRYQDMIFRLSRNETMGKYQTAFNHAARYTWLAAQAYDYETSLDPGDPAAPGTLLDQIVGERQLGLWTDGEPQAGQGGLGEILATLQANFRVLKGQLGIRAPQSATEKMSLRTELFRINSTGADSNDRWKDALNARLVEDLTAMPEFARYCRPFSTPSDGAQPGLVIRFSSHVEPGLNFFGRPLGPGDHSYSTANFATKIRGMGIWMENYNSAGLSTTPRAYLVPVGNDYLRTSSSGEPSIRTWSVQDQRIPTPFVINSADLTAPGFIPSLDGVDGGFGELRRHGDFRIYHDDGDPEADDSEIEYDSRLIGRSVWNSDWLLIIPGAGLHADPVLGLSLLTDGISDIKLHFTTYSHQGQ
jgi:hypothetical protein